MRAAILLLLLTACYDSADAVKQLEDLGRPKPIHCAILAQAGAEVRSYACTDGENVSWVCDRDDGCFKWGAK